MSWSKISKKYSVPILYYSFIVLLLILVLFSILMLFLTDSFDGTIFWLCVMFSSVIFLFIFGIFFVVYVLIQLHSSFNPREEDPNHTDKGLQLGNFVFDDNNQERQSWKRLGQTCNRSLVVFCHTIDFSLLYCKNYIS